MTGTKLGVMMELFSYIYQNINSKTLDLSSRNIDDSIAQQIAPYIKECVNLEELILDDNNIGTEGIKAIAESISSENLKILSINDNYINDDGVQHIADLMLKQKNLEFLAISHLNINELGDLITSKGAKILAKSIEQAPMLNTLILSENLIKNDGLKAIIEAINIHNSVIDLQIESNDIDDLSELAEVLKNNQSLKKIDFSANNLGDEGAKILADVLAANNMKLDKLLLVNCKIKDIGIEHLSSALQSNDTLESLYLEYNEITDQGAMHLSSLLANNTLQSLYINHNKITDIGAELFIKALRKNTSIEHAECNYNEINKELLQDIEEIVKNNRKGLIRLVLSNREMQEELSLSNEEAQELLQNIGIEEELNTTTENLVQEEFTEESEEIESNNKRTIDALDDDIIQEEQRASKKIKLEESTDQLPIQTELVGEDSSSDSCISDIELE